VKRYAYGWLTVGFFLISIVSHWLFGWYAYLDEQADLNAQVSTSAYLVLMLRDTFENWQSEFLQLIWQVVGLAYFLYVGSPASKENDDRMEAKVDALIRLVDKDKAEALIADLDERFLRTHGHARPHGHGR
jgi:hypothetical protein